MDWFLIAVLSILVFCFVLIIITLVSLLQLGDERKNHIKMKAQSYAFTLVIGFLIFEIGEKVYLSFQEGETYTGINPFTLLLTVSITYLLSLLFFKKKFGG